MQRDLDVRSKLGNHALAIEWNDAHARVGKVFRQEAASWRESVIGVRDPQIDLLNSDLQRVSRIGPFDEHRSIKDVSARSLVRDFLVNVAQVLLHLIRGHACALETRRAGGDERLKSDRVTRLDVQHRRRRRVVVSPGDCLWGGRQLEGFGVYGGNAKAGYGYSEVNLSHWSLSSEMDVKSCHIARKIKSPRNPRASRKQ